LIEHLNIFFNSAFDFKGGIFINSATVLKFNVMLKILQPQYYVDKIWNIKASTLKKMGITAVLADLDNTLVAWNKPEGGQEFFDWNETLKKEGIKLVVVSNNTTGRVSKAVKPLGLPFESWSLKPLPRGIKKTLRDYKLNKNEVIMVGDQIMTDIIAANLAEVSGVLVKPIASTDGILTKINRAVANSVVKKLNVKWESDLIERN
jgi:HAD superfamily phosphatase (TIGR01668 family)